MTLFRPWRILRSAPPAVWVITLLFTAMLAGWSMMVPQYHAPDEPNHVDAVMRLVEGRGWPHPGHANVTRGGVGAIMQAPYGGWQSTRDLSAGPFTAAESTPRDKRPTWQTLENTPAPRGGIQQLVQHPPLYYWVDAQLLRALPGDAVDLRWDEIIGILRLISVLMVAPLPLLAWAGANRLSDGSRVAGICAALVPLAVPELAHIGSSVNNDNLLVLTGALTTVAVVHVLRGDTTLRTSLYTGAFLGLALMTKSLAIVLVPMAVLAYVVAWSRARRDARALRAARPAGQATDAAPIRLAEVGPVGPSAAALRVPWRQIALGGAVMIALGGWWWIVNVVRWGKFQPETPGFPLGQYLGDDWGAYTEILINGTILRWWGSFGWFEVNLTTVPVRTGTALVIFFFAVALIRGRDWRRRVDLLFLLWVTWGLFGLMTLQSAKNFDKYFHVSGISGRYLYAGIASVAIGVGMGAAATGRYLSRIMPLLFLAGAATMQIWSISMVFPHFWRPTDGDLHDAWTNMTAWSPWSPGVAEAIAVAVCVLAALSLIVCLWTLVAPDPAAYPRRRGTYAATVPAVAPPAALSGTTTPAKRRENAGGNGSAQGLREVSLRRAARVRRETTTEGRQTGLGPCPDRGQADPPSAVSTTPAEGAAPAKAAAPATDTRPDPDIKPDPEAKPDPDIKRDPGAAPAAKIAPTGKTTSTARIVPAAGNRPAEDAAASDSPE